MPMIRFRITCHSTLIINSVEELLLFGIVVTRTTTYQQDGGVQGHGNGPGDPSKVSWRSGPWR